MSIVIVGGNDRMATRYQDICKTFNFKSKVFTGTCSHKMLGGVKSRSEKHGIPVVHVHSSSVSALKQLLATYKPKQREAS